ncbi:raffinose/stachyose/melibiose transport system permease protein [Ruania alba]|uniref:Raffinose/stachyose/melibiose transport system permease protein n=1 Tax=Ruania alba TaxID=648782 RepID=A0A1H5NDL2_9MICO|nr:raffinose/stachyose/melibiose transport system permease protein [Ruania alba]
MRTTKRLSRSSTRPPFWFAIPALTVYAFVVIYPSLSGAVYAFTDWSGLGEDLQFVGLDNFRSIFSDGQSLDALSNAILLTVMIVVVQNGVGLLLALGVNARLKARNVLRTIFFAPAVVSPVVVAFLWKYLFDPRQDQGINAILGMIGLDFLQQDWLGDPDIALWAIGMTIVWQLAGYSMVIFLAGLQGIPKGLYEAAALDGAGPFWRFRSVTIPMLAPAITIVVMLSTIGGLKLFDQVFAMTNGGPGYATEMPSTLIYKEAFVYGNYGYSTAVALVLTLLVGTIALVQLRWLRSKETEG